ncbi:DNA phosphorothioation-dependent restriction protein DptH [Cytobacillus gottheilii]|uniref:DNA phosphorothioation-dependent restriction protein DptH n=1 Tax=Cytobacillus gottheilii TaxID=859144 RepID=UPI003CF1117A
MSNQFYNYIASLLSNFFEQEGIKNGDRFYLQLDNENDVMHLVSALQSIEGSEVFKYKHDLGEEYETFQIPYQNTRLVVAYTSKNVKPDFLVTLRNLVGEQKTVWEGTALLSIVSEQLDSIQGGSSDLQKEGMPLHPNSIFSKLKNEIDNSELTKVDQIILIDNLDNLMDEQFYQQITFFEFEDIFTTLQNGFINDKEYYKFGLFKDPELDRFKGREQKERLRKNREFFDHVRKVHDYGLDQSELESKFSSDGAKQLMSDGWEEKLFTDVNKFHEEHLKLIKKGKVDFNEIKISNKLKHWDKPLSEKASGKRKRHIVIFNPDRHEEVEVQLSFNLSGNIKSLNKDYFKFPKKISNSIKYDVKKSNIAVTITSNQDNPTFVRFSYKHDQKLTLGAEFNIVILSVDPLFMDRYKSKYSVNSDQELIELHFEEDELVFGDGMSKKEVEVIEGSQEVTVTDDETLLLVPVPEAFNDNDELNINIIKNGIPIPFLLKNELPDSMPITGQRLSKLIRETGKDMQWIKENNRLILENREFYFHSEYREYFLWEAEFIDSGLKSANFDADQLRSIDLKLSDDLREAYSRYITYFESRNTIPSLCVVTDDLEKRALEYLKVYQNEIIKFDDGLPAGKRGRDLFKLGTIYSEESIYLTPFHPLMVAFKLKTYELLKKEEIDNSIFSRLSPDSLIPLIYDEKETLYKPDYQKDALEWMVYKPVQKVSVSDANQYLAKVVSDKIAQFKEHFAYLFSKASKAPLQLNVINISNDKEVVRGILDWMLKEIEKRGPENVKPVEVALFNEGNFESSFDLYAHTEKAEEVEQLFDVRLKRGELEAEDTLRIIRSKLFFYKQDINEDIRYAHISFYKMHAQEHHAVQPMKDMITGISIQGLHSSIPSMKDDETYKSGFGIKAYTIEENDYLVSTALYVNELAANLRNGGNDSYRKGEAILSRTTTADEETLEKIFKSSYWVTFVDPSIDLEFFNKYDGNLVVIHYSDQYSSSSRYDAITVTDKSEQYFAVIKEFLAQKEVKGTAENVQNTIKAFNTFNGEWLLRIIGSKGHFDREKLSIISAIKYSLSYLDHPNILWVPISLEEVLRVAGAVSLNKSDGVFTAKNLGVKGSHSDDLLLIGLEVQGNEISLHFYPIEVKIGINSGDVLEKARLQVRKTKALMLNALSNEDESFSSVFYRNFFVQLFLSNAQKLLQSELWEEKGYAIENSVLEKLLKDEYKIINALNKYIGDGAIISFQKNAYHRSAHLDEDVLLLNLTERDGYEGLVTSIKSMRHWIQEEPNDFIKEEMLSYRYSDQKNVLREETTSQSTSTTSEREVEYKYEGNTYSEEHKGYTDGPEKLNSQDRELTEEVPIKEEQVPEPFIKPKEEMDRQDRELMAQTPKEEQVSEPLKTALEEVRIKIGKAERSNRDIYWEYGNRGLSNRHLLISGKSGQGKTYFMQCLLLEKSKLGIPSIVIDYTEGFLPNQLEPEFVNYLGDKLKQKIVYSEKLPINPFQKNVRDIGGIQLPESDTDVAERIKSVFAAVYKSLGIQQQNAIYEAILNGLGLYGENMSLVKLKEMLEEDGSSYAKTALSQIRPLIDRNPFSNENTIDWKDVVNSDGEVFIIQLTGFPRDVQLMITEFILWDLWNYSVRFGNKNNPMPVIMDEAQNLDHTEKSPSARILTEGRKFGWSAWYATQFLKSQLDADELARLQNSAQKVYFSPPEQEISNIAASLSKDAQEKKDWEAKLSSLRKGQCIVHGPILKDNGELTPPIVTIVDISSLSERI